MYANVLGLPFYYCRLVEKGIDRGLRKDIISHDQVLNKAWNSPEQVLNKFAKVLDMSWKSIAKALNKY